MLLPSLGNGRRLLFLVGAVSVSGKLNLTFFSFFSFSFFSVRDAFSVDVNLFSVVVNADDFVFFVAALFRISTHPCTVSGLLPGYWTKSNANNSISNGERAKIIWPII